jgi:hypothetical protein
MLNRDNRLPAGAALACAALILGAACSNPPAPTPTRPQLTEEEKLVALCRQILDAAEQSESFWVKVHVAEFRLALGQKDYVHKLWTDKVRRVQGEPMLRIGAWRVLTQSAAFGGPFALEIEAAYMDEDGLDRLHAVESLARLGGNVLMLNEDLAMKDLNGDDPLLSLYVRWSMANSSGDEPPSRASIVAGLASEDEREARISAFSLRHLGHLSESDLDALIAAADNPTGPSVPGFALCAAYANGVEGIEDRIIKLLSSDRKSDRFEACTVLGERPAEAAEEALKAIVNNENPLDDSVSNEDVMAAAAYALLAQRRAQSS